MVSYLMAEADTFWARIYIAGPQDVIEQVCREYCFEIPMCVTVEDTKFIYKGGEETGVVIGIVNYPRFPQSSEQLEQYAHNIARRAMIAACQESYLVVTPQRSTWYTRREANFPKSTQSKDSYQCDTTT